MSADQTRESATNRCLSRTDNRSPGKPENFLHEPLRLLDNGWATSASIQPCVPPWTKPRQIEAALDVTISRRGEHFSVHGAGATAGDTSTRFTFYQCRPSSISVEEIQLGLVESTNTRRLSAPREERRCLVTPRAPTSWADPAAVQYARYQAHDITFSIGPAGYRKDHLAVACTVDALEARPGEAHRRTGAPGGGTGDAWGSRPGTWRRRWIPIIPAAVRRPIRNAGLRRGGAH